MKLTKMDWVWLGVIAVLTLFLLSDFYLTLANYCAR